MKRVLISRDIRAVLENDRSFLDRSDIEAISTTTNKEALALHQAHKAALIIANLDTPEMTGEDLCSTIRADESLRDVSIIIVCPETAENLQRCTHCYANSFLSSPVNSAVLLQEAYQLLHISPRRSCRMLLRIGIEGGAGGRPFSGSIENISTTGLLFITTAVMFEGDVIQCSFELPESGRIFLSAEVVRTVEDTEGSSIKKRYGVRFTDIGDADAANIEAFVKEKSRPHPMPC